MQQHWSMIHAHANMSQPVLWSSVLRAACCGSSPVHGHAAVKAVVSDACLELPHALLRNCYSMDYWMMCVQEARQLHRGPQVPRAEESAHRRARGARAPAGGAALPILLLPHVTTWLVPHLGHHAALQLQA